MVKAVGGGAASITASSEGVASQKLNLIVISPCCEVGDGAPPAVQQSFKDALTRNKITVQPPIPSPAARVGGGYVQMRAVGRRLGRTYVLAQSDKIGTAYVVGGAVLAAWQSHGWRRRIARVSGQRPQPGRHAALRERRGAGRQSRCAWSAAASSPSGGCSAMRQAPRARPFPTPPVFSTFGANSGVAQAFAGGAIYQRHGRSAQSAGLLRHRPDPAALQRARRRGRRLRHAGQRRVRHRGPASAEFRRRQHHLVGGRQRGQRAPGGQDPGLIVSPAAAVRGQPGALRGGRLPERQHASASPSPASPISR